MNKSEEVRSAFDKMKGGTQAGGAKLPVLFPKATAADEPPAAKNLGKACGHEYLVMIYD